MTTQNDKTGGDKPNLQQKNDAAGQTSEQKADAGDAVEKNPKVFGAAEGKANDRKTPLERQTGFASMTSDQQHAVENKGKPLHKPVKTEGRQVELGDRVMLHTATPIGGQTVNPAHVIGFTPKGLANLRLELIDGGQQRPQEYGGVPQNAAQEERGPFWTWPDDKGAETE